MSKVYWVKTDFKKNLRKIYQELAKKFSPGKVAIKVHFGEEGCLTHLNPNLVKILTDFIKESYLIECNVLYKGKRTFKASHLELAKAHGFDFAPIIIGDGEKGDDFMEIKVNQKHFKKIKVAKGLRAFQNLVVFSHFTGHLATGFGGALKNLGMGLGSRAGKLAMHSETPVSVDPDKCTACGWCVENCPAKAISLIESKAFVNQEKCLKCAKCIGVCQQKAITIPWDLIRGKSIQERIVEYCYGLNKICQIIYFTSLQNITLNCDCYSQEQKPILKDLGVLASADGVAIDQAAIDLVRKKMGKDIFKQYHGIDSSFQLSYAEKLGLGSRAYQLEVD